MDKRHKLIHVYQVTGTSVHDSRCLEALLDPENAGIEIFAGSAYRSEESEQLLQEKGYRNRIHDRAYRNRPLSKAKEKVNTRRSRRRARVEHVFGAIAQQGGKILRTVGIARAKVKIGMMNLVCNIRHFTYLLKQEVAW